jgi:hypothetical protein
MNQLSPFAVSSAGVTEAPFTVTLVIVATSGCAFVAGDASPTAAAKLYEAVPVFELYTWLPLVLPALVAVTAHVAAALAVRTPEVIVQLAVLVANDTAPDPEPPELPSVTDMPTANAVLGEAETLNAACAVAATNMNDFAADVAAL